MDEQTKNKLSEPLDKSLVMERKVSSRNVQYLEGHASIRNANKVFGFDGWSYEVSMLILTPCGENQNGNKVVSGQATVKVSALGQSREDVGYGEGIAKALPAAHESAGKEAVTDGLKRALRSFGDQFGNGLYDKRFDHTWVPDEDDEILGKIAEAKSVKDLEKLYKAIPANERNTYNAVVGSRKRELAGDSK
jgi:DNA repair and recombination protein RAD52